MHVKLVSTKLNLVDPIIFWLLATTLALTPLIYVTGTNEIFEFPKMTFVYIMGALLLPFVVYKLMKENPKTVFTGKTSLLLWVLLLSTSISSIFSMSLYTSLFGYYTRFYGGLLSMMAMCVFYFAILAVKNRTSVNKLLLILCFSLIPVAIKGFGQKAGLEKQFWVEDSQARIFSTLGQPNWLAAFIDTLIFLVLFFAYNSTGRKKWVWGFLFTFIWATLWFTYSLSGFLGFFIGLLVFIYSQRKKVFTQKALTAVLASTLLAIPIIFPGVFKPKLDSTIKDIKSSLGAMESRAYAANDIGDFGDSTDIRILVLKGAMKIPESSVKNFLIGTGPETFPYAFLAYRPSQLETTSEWDFVFNKPHNYFLELLCNGGAFGFLAYILFLVSVLKCKSKPDLLPLKIGLVALSVTDFFGWHTVSTALLFFAFAGILAGSEIYENKSA